MMNWEAIGAVGEISGALAVVATLVYLATQVKSMKTAVNTEALGDTQNEFNFLFSQMLEHAELVQRADFGEELTETERMKIGLLYRAHMSHSIHCYVRNMAIGFGADLPPASSADELKEHPAFMNIWLQEPAPENSLVGRWYKLVGTNLAGANRDGA